jgi:hypothetical protein
MKKIILLAVFVAISSFSLLAQGPPPVPPSSANQGGTGPVGDSGTGGAPIGNGIVLLITLAAGYGAKKVFTGMNADKTEI